MYTSQSKGEQNTHNQDSKRERKCSKNLNEGTIFEHLDEQKFTLGFSVQSPHPQENHIIFAQNKIVKKKWKEKRNEKLHNCIQKRKKGRERRNQWNKNYLLL
jgi:hypothetical protein